MTGRKRLLYINTLGADEFAGGAEAYVARLADGLAARGYDVEVLAAFESPTRRSPSLHGGPWRRSGIGRFRHHARDVISTPTRQLTAALSRLRPDLVHTNNLPGFSTAVWEVARRRGAPVVHTLHDYHLLCPRVTLLRPDGAACRPHPLLCGLRTRRLVRWAGAVSHVIGVSEHVLSRHAALFPSANLETIRHPVERTPRRPLTPPGGRLETLGYLGALEHTKGVDRLLAAAPELARRGVTLCIAGDGRLRGKVEAAAAERENVTYNGPVSDAAKDDFLERCDAGILPSVWEEPGAPTLTAVEWLAAGRPLLTSARGGMAEVLPGLPGAFPIDPTVDGICHGTEQLLRPGAWREAIRRARARLDIQDVESWLDDHERVYVSALERRR